MSELRHPHTPIKINYYALPEIIDSLREREFVFKFTCQYPSLITELRTKIIKKAKEEGIRKKNIKEHSLSSIHWDNNVWLSHTGEGMKGKNIVSTFLTKCRVYRVDINPYYWKDPYEKSKGLVFMELNRNLESTIFVGENFHPARVIYEECSEKFKAAVPYKRLVSTPSLTELRKEILNNEGIRPCERKQSMINIERIMLAEQYENWLNSVLDKYL